MNKETIRELRERADGMITAGIADSRVRSCVHDIEFDFVRRDGRHDVQDVINLELDRRTAADEMPHVTPDTVVKCPECGATFRVGKALVQTKGEAASRRLFKNAARRSESARLLCKPKGKRRLAACSRWKFRFRQAARTPLPLCGTHENERKRK